MCSAWFLSLLSLWLCARWHTGIIPMALVCLALYASVSVLRIVLGMGVGVSLCVAQGSHKL